MHETRERVLWDRVALGALIVVVSILGIWWLESRFGALVAVMTVGAVIAVGLVLFGFTLASRNTRHTLEIVADFLHEIKAGDKNQWGVIREYARADSNALRKQADMEYLNFKRVDQMAQQRAKMISDQQKSDSEQWEWENDNRSESEHNSGFQVYE